MQNHDLREHQNLVEVLQIIQTCGDNLTLILVTGFGDRIGIDSREAAQSHLQKWVRLQFQHTEHLAYQVWVTMTVLALTAH